VSPIAGSRARPFQDFDPFWVDRGFKGTCHRATLPVRRAHASIAARFQIRPAASTATGSGKPGRRASWSTRWLVTPRNSAISDVALTARLLFSGRSLPNQARHFATPDLIAAAKGELGDHFGHDYALLSDLAHPNALLVWGSDRLERAGSEARSVTEAQAELLAKVAGQGLRAVGHNALNLLDWALEHDTFLVTRVEPPK
jgi:hypothetical protein